MLHLCLSLKYCACQLFMVDVNKFWWQFFNILHVVSLKTLTIVWHNSSSTKHWNKIYKRLTKFCQLFSFVIFFWILTKICQNFSTTKCKSNKLTKVWQNFIKFLSTSLLVEFWQKFDKNIDKKVPISQQFHETLPTFCLLRFSVVASSLYTVQRHEILVSEVYVAFLCITSMHLIYSICCLLYFLSIFHFRFSERSAGEKAWVK